MLCLCPSQTTEEEAELSMLAFPVRNQEHLPGGCQRHHEPQVLGPDRPTLDLASSNELQNLEPSYPETEAVIFDRLAPHSVLARLFELHCHALSGLPIPVHLYLAFAGEIALVGCCVVRILQRHSLAVAVRRLRFGCSAVVSVHSVGLREWRGLSHGVYVLSAGQSGQRELHLGLAWPGVLVQDDLLRICSSECCNLVSNEDRRFAKWCFANQARGVT